MRILGLSVLVFAALLFSSSMALAQFSQQGSKLVGTGATGAAQQGNSVSLSSDGNTAIVGGWGSAQVSGSAIFAESQWEIAQRQAIRPS